MWRAVLWLFEKFIGGRIALTNKAHKGPRQHPSIGYNCVKMTQFLRFDAAGGV